MKDPRDIAESAVIAIELDELLGILTHWQKHCDTQYVRASLAIAARRAVEAKHLGELEE